MQMPHVPTLVGVVVVVAILLLLYHFFIAK